MIMGVRIYLFFFPRIDPLTLLQADVGHPAAYSRDRPSFSSVVASVDSNTSLYVADCRVQEPRLEIIADLEAMTKVGSYLYC